MEQNDHDAGGHFFVGEQEVLTYDEMALVKMAMLDAADQGVILMAPDPLSFSISTVHVPVAMGDAGAAAPYMLQDEPVVELADPYVALLMTDFESMMDLVPFLEEVMKSSRGLLVVTTGMAREVLSTLALNKKRGTFDSVAVECFRHDPFYETVASLTGATVFENGSLADFTFQMAGRASRVVVDRNRALVIGGPDSQSARMAPFIRVGGMPEEADAKTRAIKEMVAKSGGALDVIELKSCPA